MVAPISILEIRKSGSLQRCAIAGASTWSSAVFSYYLFYTILLAFKGLPHMDHLLISNRAVPTFWKQWSIAFQRIILAQILEWILIAIMGRCILGFLPGFVYRKWQENKIMI